MKIKLKRIGKKLNGHSKTRMMRLRTGRSMIAKKPKRDKKGRFC